MIACVLLYRHRTDDYFVPIWTYLASIRLVFPPLLLLFISYLLVFMGGVSLGDAPKAIIKYLKNRFFQSLYHMITFSVITTLLTIIIALYLNINPPIQYVAFVKDLLGAESDAGIIVKKKLLVIREKNPDLYRKFSIVVDVFEERQKRNFYNAPLKTTQPRIFVRSLEANISNEWWRRHPLRKLALAEAYSMWVQAILNSQIIPLSEFDWKKYLSNCVQINSEILLDTSPLAMPLIKHSALNNTGNVYLYAGDFEKAIDYYQKTLSENKNLSTEGNLIAAYILANNIGKAIVEADSANEWGFSTGKALIEPSPFSAVLGNGGFAKMIKGDHTEAIIDLSSAYDLVNDDLNALNLAMACELAGKRSVAKIVLADLKQTPIDPGTQQKIVQENNYNACYCFVAAFTESNDLATMAAYFHAYLGEPITKDQLTLENLNSINELKKKVWNEIKKDRSPCGYFQLVPDVKFRLIGNPK